MSGYYLTRHAAHDLQDIYGRSVETWGERVANEYLEAVYGVFEMLAKSPELGQARRERSNPFLMYPANKHFVIYDTFPQGTIIVTLLHQVRRIENIIQKLDSAFFIEIDELKKRFHKRISD